MINQSTSSSVTLVRLVQQRSQQQQRDDLRHAEFRRHLVLGAVTLMLALLLANANAYSLAVLCFRVAPNDDASDLNEAPQSAVGATVAAATTNASSRVRRSLLPDPGDQAVENQLAKLAYSRKQRAWLVLVSEIGIACGILPFTFLLIGISTRRAVLIYGTISAISTFLLPISVQIGYMPLLACRLIQNFSLGCAYPLMGRVTADWADRSARATFLAILSSHVEIGMLMAYPITGIACASLRWRWAPDGWQSVYYGLAAATLLALLLFYAIYEDLSPLTRAHSPKLVGMALRNIDLHKIADNLQLFLFGYTRCASNYAAKKRGEEKAAQILPPIWHVIADACVWCNGFALCGAAFAFAMGTYTAPIFINTLQQVNMRTTGLACAFPFAVSAVAKIAVGLATDCASFWPREFRFVWVFAISQSVMMFILISCGTFSMATVPGLLFGFSALLATGGTAQVLICVNIQLISLHYSFIAMAVVYFVQNLFSATLPVFIFFILNREDRFYQWAILYFIITALLAAAMSLFVFNAQCTPRAWARNGYGERRDANAPCLPSINVTQHNSHHQHHLLIPGAAMTDAIDWALDCQQLRAPFELYGGVHSSAYSRKFKVAAPSDNEKFNNGAALALCASGLASDELKIRLGNSSTNALHAMCSNRLSTASENVAHFHPHKRRGASNAFFANFINHSAMSAKNLKNASKFATANQPGTSAKVRDRHRPSGANPTYVMQTLPPKSPSCSWTSTAPDIAGTFNLIQAAQMQLSGENMKASPTHP